MKRLLFIHCLLILGLWNFSIGQESPIPEGGLINTFPYIETFDMGANGWAVGGTTPSWELGLPAGTVISGAPPTSLDTSSWMTGLSTPYNSNEDSWIMSPEFDFSSLTDPQLSVDIWWEIEFFYDGVVFQSSIDQGVTWQNVGAFGDLNNWFNYATISSAPGGQNEGWSGTATNGSGEWVTALHALTGLAGQSSVFLRFAVASDGSVNHDGFAFDNIIIQDPPPIAAEFGGFTSPTPIICGNANTPISVLVINNGTDPLTGFTAGFGIDGGSFITEVFGDTIYAGDTTDLAFMTTADLSAGGQRTLTGFVTALGDANSLDDTLAFVIQVLPSINAYPYSEDFSGGPGGWYSGGANTSWELGIPAGSTIIGGPPSAADTNSWMTGLATPYNNNEVSFLQGPCFDFSGINIPTISFDIWWHSEANWDGTVLQSSIDGGATWQNVGAFGDPNNWYNSNALNANPGGQPEGWAGTTGSGGSGNWVNAVHDLDGLGGQPSVFLRFAFGSDGFVSDDGVAIDNIVIQQISTTDATIVDFQSPPRYICPDDTLETRVTIANIGTDTISSYNVVFFVDSILLGTFVPVDTTLAPGDTAVATMPIPISPWASLSDHQIQAILNATGDGDSSNNSINRQVSVLPQATLPLTQDFEGGALLPFLNDANDANQDWLLNSGGTPSTGTGPSADHTLGTAAGVYAYLEDSQNDNFPVNLLSPCMQVNGALEASFWYHSHDDRNGTNENLLTIKSCTNSGCTTQAIIGHNLATWQQQQIALGTTPAGQVYLIFEGSTDNSNFSHDIAIDDIEAVDVVANDGAVYFDIGLLNDTLDICQEASNPTARLIVENMGTDVMNGYTVIINRAVGGPDTIMVSTPLAPGAKDTIEVSLSVLTFASSGVTTVTATLINNNNDQNSLNDIDMIEVNINTGGPAPAANNAVVCDIGDMATIILDKDNTFDGIFELVPSQGGTPSYTDSFFDVFMDIALKEFMVKKMAKESSSNVGAPNDFIGSADTTSVYSNGLVFDVLRDSPIKLDTIRVVVTDTGLISIAVYDSLDNVVGITTFYVDSVLYDSLFGEIPVPICMIVPPGSGYEIRAEGTTIPSLVYNTSGALYPYEDPNGFIRILGPTTGSTNTYYFFYNWEISSFGCRSESRPVKAQIARDVYEPNDFLAVDLPVMGINRNAALCNKQDVDKFLLLLDEPNLVLQVTRHSSNSPIQLEVRNLTTNQVVATITDTAGSAIVLNQLAQGPYTIILSDVGSVDSKETGGYYSLTYQKSSLPFSMREVNQWLNGEVATEHIHWVKGTALEQELWQGAINLYPNPNNGNFSLRIGVANNTNLQLTISDIYGKVVMQMQESLQQGENTLDVNLESLGSGLYFIEGTAGNQHFIKRFELIR